MSELNYHQSLGLTQSITHTQPYCFNCLKLHEVKTHTVCQKQWRYLQCLQIMMTDNYLFSLFQTHSARQIYFHTIFALFQHMRHTQTHKPLAICPDND